MSNTIKLQRVRGFTLIELLVVIAIIGLLATIIAAPIQNARKKARDSKKIAEVKAVQLALDQYAEANAGQYPRGIGYLYPTYMPLIPSFASTSLTTVNDRDKFAYTPYQAAGTGISIGGLTFAYHLGVHLENFSQGLDNDRDCTGADHSANFSTNVGTSTCAFYPASVSDVFGYYVASTTATNADNYKTGMMPNPSFTNGQIGAGTVNDFDGSDGDTTKCNATTDCVFDVTGQQ